MIWSEDVERQLRAMSAWGWTDKKIAGVFGVSTMTVSRWRKAAGLPCSRSIPRFRHGRESGYNSGCRCTPCTEAHRLRGINERQRRRELTAANGGVAPTDKHGAATRENWGCNCAVCIEGKRLANAAYYYQQSTEVA